MSFDVSDEAVSARKKRQRERLTRQAVFCGVSYEDYAAWPTKQQCDVYNTRARKAETFRGGESKNASADTVDKPTARHAVKRKPHERKMCGFRVLHAEMAEIEAMRKIINKAEYARGTDPHRLKHPFTLSDIFRGAVLALVAETAARDPDWAGIIADIRGSMP